jgi:AcrR family transcriptional regulator
MSAARDDRGNRAVDGRKPIQTPWGRSSDLRKRKLQPGSGTPREEVIRNQRERLFGAIVAVVSEKGYEATTVADVIALSGVSRGDFYKHFSNKAEALAAAAEALSEQAMKALGEIQGDGSNPRSMFERTVELIQLQPAAARVFLIDLHAIGPLGEAVAERGLEAFLGQIDRDDSGGTLPGNGEAELTRALIGGVGKVICTRLYRRQEAELGDLAPELWSWLTSVVPPPHPLPTPRRQRASAAARFQGYTPGERIARAVAAVLARKGYLATSTDDIAAQAAISLSTFYEHFADKRDAVLAAIEMSGAQITALAVPAARRAPNWQEGMRSLYESICAYFAAEPDMAHLATVGVYEAGVDALARRDRFIDALTAMLVPGLEENPQAPPIAAEAAGAAVYALMRDQVRRKGPEDLAATVPLATYLTLVGFVGPEQACRVASEGGRRR